VPRIEVSFQIGSRLNRDPNAQKLVQCVVPGASHATGDIELRPHKTLRPPHNAVAQGIGTLGSERSALLLELLHSFLSFPFFQWREKAVRVVTLRNRYYPTAESKLRTAKHRADRSQ